MMGLHIRLGAAALIVSISQSRLAMYEVRNLISLRRSFLSVTLLLDADIHHHNFVVNGFVQGENFPGVGWRLLADGDGGTIMRYAVCTDIKGWIPHRIVNRAMVKTFEDLWSGLLKALQAGEHEEKNT